MDESIYSLVGFEKGYTQGEADAIRACARLVASLGICHACPLRCYRGTEKTCSDKWAIYFADVIEKYKKLQEETDAEM